MDPDLRILARAPIFLVSTHGYYYLDDEPRSFVVPNNTFVFETGSVTELTSVEIDPPLWDLVSGEFRYWFLNYFTGEEDPKADVETNEMYRKLFRSMHFYQPGDRIYVRDLGMSGGRTANGSWTERGVYSMFGFYKFPAESKMIDFPQRGRPRPSTSISALEPLRDEMVTGDTVITNEDVLVGSKRRFFAEKGQPAIFVFSSCGEEHCTLGSRVCRERSMRIEQHQHAIDLRNLARGLVTPIGGLGESIPMQPSKYSNARATFVADAEEHSGNRVNQFNLGEFVSTENSNSLLSTQWPRLEQPKKTMEIYQVNRLDPRKPYSSPLRQSNVKSMKRLASKNGSMFFRNVNVRELLLSKKRRPGEYGNSRFYTRRGKRLNIIPEAEFEK
jgi:hypothetical protein